MAVPLDLHVLAHGHRPGPSDPAQVVPPEVDEHHVLGAFLGIALELIAEQRVLALVRAPRTGPGDRVGRQPVPDDLEQELGAGADDLVRRHPDEEQVRAGIDASEGPVQPDAVEGAARHRWAGGRASGVVRAPPGSPRRPRSHPWRPSPHGCRHRDPATSRCALPGSAAPSRSPRCRCQARRRSGGRSARGPRRQRARRSGSGPRDPGHRCGATRWRYSVWVRWSKTRTRSLSMNAAVGTPTGSRSGSGTVGSKDVIAS